MQALDQQARAAEISNLPETSAAAEGNRGDTAAAGRIAECGNLLKTAEFRGGGTRSGFADAVRVPDEYLLLRRVAGLYPVTQLFVSLGVSRWQAQARRGFTNEPPEDWKTTRYRPQPAGSGERVGAPFRRDPLGIPVFSSDTLANLFLDHAPIWEIQYGGQDDRIGTPFWTSAGTLDVDTREPRTFSRLSFTRFEGQVLPQLNYIIWFPARPKRGFWDLYGGRLDGLIYRVTLDESGEPILYETVHNCGCYYKAYPTRRLKLRNDIDYAEPPLVFSAPEPVSGQTIMTVSMESGTHYVTHFYSTQRLSDPDGPAYSLADYEQLRSLPVVGGGRRSMFGQDSIAAGSERLERFILWPTGVLSPGAMRQWGRHAVAFVGKRHFDDPFYMEKMFVGAKRNGP